jgi:predicted nuclease of predicted toxin-antitoxin system
LRQFGRDVACVTDIAPRASDEAMMQLAAHDARLLPTEDKDFGDRCSAK